MFGSLKLAIVQLNMICSAHHISTEKSTEYSHSIKSYDTPANFQRVITKKKERERERERETGKKKLNTYLTRARFRTRARDGDGFRHMSLSPSLAPTLRLMSPTPLMSRLWWMAPKMDYLMLIDTEGTARERNTLGEPLLSSGSNGESVPLFTFMKMVPFSLVKWTVPMLLEGSRSFGKDAASVPGCWMSGHLFILISFT